MGLFDDIPMVDERRAGRQSGFDPAAGQMQMPIAPPEPDEEQSEFTDPVRLAQRGLRAAPLPGGAPPGPWMPPDLWEAWRKGAIDGIMGARRFYRESIGSLGGGGDDDEGCREEWKGARMSA